MPCPPHSDNQQTWMRLLQRRRSQQLPARNPTEDPSGQEEKDEEDEDPTEEAITTCLAHSQVGVTPEDTERERDREKEE